MNLTCTHKHTHTQKNKSKQTKNNTITNIPYAQARKKYTYTHEQTEKKLANMVNESDLEETGTKIKFDQCRILSDENCSVTSVSWLPWRCGIII